MSNAVHAHHFRQPHFPEGDRKQSRRYQPSCDGIALVAEALCLNCGISNFNTHASILIYFNDLSNALKLSAANFAFPHRFDMFATNDRSILILS